MKQKSLIVRDTSESELNRYLNEGWRVVSVTSGHSASTINWKWLVILEK